MTELGEILWCEKCGKRESFVVSGSGRKAVCLKCRIEVLDLPELRCKAVHDCLFEMFGRVSNRVDNKEPIDHSDIKINEYPE